MKTNEFKFIEIQPYLFESIVKSNEKFRALIDLTKPMMIRYMPDIFLCLIHTIISYNNNSERIDESWNRLKMYVKKINPFTLSTLNKETFMSCEIDDYKIDLIRKISHDISIGKIDFKKIQKMDDQDIFKIMEQYKGINLWIIQTWLIFGVGHANVIVFDDLIIIEAIKYCFSVTKVTNKLLEQIYQAYSPNCTMLSFILWKIGNTITNNDLISRTE